MQSKTVRSEELIEFWSYLSHLTGASLPLAQSLDIVASMSKNTYFRNVIYQIIYALTQGESFSEAIHLYPKIFLPSVLQLITLAEQTGHYSPIFERLEQQEKWRQQVKQLVAQSLRYPFILLGIMVLFIFILIGWLIPNLRGYLDLIGKKELPLMTKMLIFMGDHIQGIFVGVLGVVVLFILSVILRRLFNLKPLRYLLPGIGVLLFRLQVLNFGHNLGILLKAKIDILAALYHGAQSTPCRWLKQSLLNQEHVLVSGHSLSQALTPILGADMVVTRMIIVGEKSGDLADLLIRITEFELIQTQLKLKTILEYLQPLMIILMGGLLAWTVLAILLPLYDAIGAVNG